MNEYFYNLAISIDQLINTIFCGYPDETLSSRIYRMSLISDNWNYLRIFVDTIFFWQEEHCYESYISEVERNQCFKL